MDKNEIIQYLKKHQNELREMFGVIKIGLFGSYVTGNHEEDSDIDICVTLDEKHKRLHNFLALERELSSVFEKKVDLGLEESLKPFIKKQIEKEIIYV